MTKLLTRLFAIGLALGTALPAFAADQASAGAAVQTPVATVNGVAIPPIYADVVRQDLARGNTKLSDEDIQNVLINNELLAQEAVKEGLDKPAETKALLDLQRKDTLGKLLIQEYTKKHPVSEQRIQAEYDKFKAKVGDKQYHVRHILVADEKTADDIIKQLTAKKPASFEELAKKYSKDAGSAGKGGDIGWVTPTDLVPEFSATMVKLKKNEVSPTPVKTQFGWHVIQLLDTRKLELPSLDQLKDRIAQTLMKEDVRTYLESLRKNAKIDLPSAK
ncbi:MAG TPA: peptidylprolyl isomerase [Parasulfuritortus sp.]